jgi:hypothetical protein
MRAWAIAALTAAVAPLQSPRAEMSGTVRVSSGVGIDTNVRRDYAQLGAQADAFAFINGAGRAQLVSERARAAGEYELGGRMFLLTPEESVLVQALNAEGSLRASENVGIGLHGRGKDRRGGQREYTDLAGGSFVDVAPSRDWDVRAEAGIRRFIYRPFFPYSFTAAELTTAARYRLAPRHSFALTGSIDLRFFNASAQTDPRGDANAAAPQRQDVGFLGGLSYTYRGPLLLTLSYSFGGASSNSFGETFFRHRLTGSAGLRMPWEVTLLAQVALQLTHYPDGAYSSPELVLLEDDNQNSLSLKLLRPLSGHLDAELTFAAYHAKLPQNGLTYDRQVAWIGVAWRL